MADPCIGRRLVYAVIGIVCATAVLALGRATCAADTTDNMVNNGDAETGTLGNWKGFDKVVSEGAHSGKYCFSRKGYAVVTSKELMPVDPRKTYVLSGWFKSVGQGQSLIYLGYVPLDEKKKVILPDYVTYIPGTETTLAEDCRKDDTVIKIVNGAKWISGQYMRIAFDVDDSGQRGDLPNANISSRNITKVENKDDYWAVSLKAKCGRAYPAGTKVREHKSGATFIYNAASRKPVPSEWKQFTGRIKGLGKSGVTYKQWWPGTKYAQVLILANFMQGKEFEVLVDDISVTVAK